MTHDAEPSEPKQTTPTGVEIRVPTRDEFFRDLRKVAPPDKPQRHDEPAKGPDEPE